MSTVSISEASRNLSHWINRASYGEEYVVLTSRGKPKAILMGMDQFETLLHMDRYSQRDLRPIEYLRAEIRESLAEAGYATNEDIVTLVREVKRDLAAAPEVPEPIA